MSDTFITVVVIAVVAILIFVLPLVTMAERVDSASQTDVQTLASDFINEVFRKFNCNRKHIWC